MATRVPADLERWRKARDAIHRRIMDRGWSPTLKAFDGVRGAEGTFSACSFWYVEALTGAGRWTSAAVRCYANHLGLYAEQISRTGQQQGNFPRR